MKATFTIPETKLEVDLDSKDDHGLKEAVEEKLKESDLKLEDASPEDIKSALKEIIEDDPIAFIRDDMDLYDDSIEIAVEL